MNRLSIRAVSAIAAFIAFAGAAAPSSQGAVRTLNLDFANSGHLYAGDDGVLSSPGGTFWNPVGIIDEPNIGLRFVFTELLDEFGVAFNDILSPPYGQYPEVYSWGNAGDLTTSTAPGPLRDGFHLEPTEALGVLIRPLSTTAPIDLVVYFHSPDGASLTTNAIAVNETYSSGQTAITTLPPQNFVFPGAENIDYVKFENLTASPTTLGTPQLPGLNITVPAGRAANIAAIQIRGEFIVPEPASIVMMFVALTIAVRRGTVGLCVIRSRAA